MNECNSDPQAFKSSAEYLNIFDPNRNNLDKILPFNTDSAFETQELNISLFLLSTIIDIMIENYNCEIPAQTSARIISKYSYETFFPKYAHSLVNIINSYGTFSVNDIKPDINCVSKIDLKTTESVFRTPLIDIDSQYKVNSFFRKIFNEYLKINHLILPVDDIPILWEHPAEETSNDWVNRNLNPEKRIQQRLKSYDDIEYLSDSSMALFAFSGIGCHLTKAINANAKIDPLLKKHNIRYCHDVTLLSKYKVRDGLLRYGACAYFDNNYEIQAIYVSYSNKLIFKSNDWIWEQAKYIWKTTCLAQVTIVEHLITTHLIEANVLIRNVRQFLSGNHPIRRLCKIFTFASVDRSLGAEAILSKYGLATRIYGLTYSDIQKCIASSVENYSFRSFKDRCYSNMSKEKISDDIYPIIQDAKEFYNVMHRFVNKYILLVYNKEEVFDQDEEIQSFYK
eukprot:159588_1